MDQLDVTAAYDGSFIKSLPKNDERDIETALENAKRLFKNRSGWIPKHQRIDILNTAAKLIKARRVELATEAAREGGKPLLDSLVEVDRAADGVKTCAELLRNEAGHVIPMSINKASTNHVAFTQFEPIGVVVAVSAFNHPFNLIVHQVAPAIAAGCPVIVKPAELTPLSCFNFVEILYEAGLPEAWCQTCLPHNQALSTALVTDPRVNFFSFIGSAKVGWMLRSKLSPGTRCALEHGGVAPVIVASDADLDETATSLVKGGLYHAGQVCISVQRVFADSSIRETLTKKMNALTESLLVDDPILERTNIGPLIKPSEVDRVESWVQEAIEGGANVITGGQRISERCYSPTILLDPPADAKVSTQEVFGPVICVYTMDNMNEAIEAANSLPYVFHAAVFTKNLDTAMHAYKHLNGTAIMLNEHTAFRTDWMPFAGAGESGHGVGGIPYTLRDMQVEKMLVWHSKEVQ